MSEQRVYSIKRIAPDRFIDVLKPSTSINAKTCLKEIISSQLKNPESADVTLQIGDEIFKIPMVLLQSYSKFFQKHSYHEKIIKLSPSTISPNVFHMIYSWMLSKSKLVGRDNLVPLLIGAECLEVKLLEQQIWNLIQDAGKFQEDEAFLLYLEAKYCKFKEVQLVMMVRIQKFFMTVVCSDEFLMMDAAEIHSWLELDSIGVNSELDVFHSVVRWLLHEWEFRKEFLVNLMEVVRFGVIEPCKIVEFRINKNMGKLTEILADKELQKMLEKSLSYATYRNSCNDDSSERFADFLSRFGFKRLFSRNLMIDPIISKNFGDFPFTFDQFEEYLSIIRQNATVNWKNNTIVQRSINERINR